MMDMFWKHYPREKLSTEMNSLPQRVNNLCFYHCWFQKLRTHKQAATKNITLEDREKMKNWKKKKYVDFE